MKATYPNDTDYYYQAPSRIQKILDQIGILKYAPKEEIEQRLQELFNRWEGLLK
jgi:hypothetical protein